MGMVADGLADLKLGELLETPPPGLDEAVAIAKVCVMVMMSGWSRKKGAARDGGEGGAAAEG